jgi:hypothetical protein
MSPATSRSKAHLATSHTLHQVYLGMPNGTSGERRLHLVLQDETTTTSQD